MRLILFPPDLHCIDGFNAHPAHLPQTPLHRAASIVRAVMLFRQQLKLGQLPPEATKEGPICVDTYRWMFDCCRVPGQPADWSVSYAREGDRGDSGHVIVLRRGRVWKIEPWHNGRLLDVDELQAYVIHCSLSSRSLTEAQQPDTAHIREYQGRAPRRRHLDGIEPGRLDQGAHSVTLILNLSPPRAQDYDTLAADPHNESILRTVHSAAFVLCLDAERAPDLVAHSRLLWHGALPPTPEPAQMGLRNRWMDKPCQFIVADDGAAGFVGEHSVMDGTPTAYLCDVVLDTIAAPHFAARNASIPSDGQTALPIALDWHISDATRTAIRTAAHSAHALAAGQALNIVRTPYGKAAIKAFRVSPDSWAQLLIQLAYARLLRARGERRAGGTYEAAATRRFFKGRTEAVRVVSAEADAWVASMDDPGVGAEERGRLFRKAVETHVARARRAGNGLGIDRHLLGTSCGPWCPFEGVA